MRRRVHSTGAVLFFVFFSEVIATGQTIERPVRAVPDPGVVTTRQSITPAGVQSVFSGRIYGVTFGTSSDVVYVAVNTGAIYQLNWRTNQVLKMIRGAARPGMQGIVLDPVTQEPLLSASMKFASQLIRFSGNHEAVIADHLGRFAVGSLSLTYPEIRDLLKDHVGPLFAKHHIPTGIQFREASSRQEAAREYPTVLDDPVARKYVASLAYHGYDFGNFGAIAGLRERYPDLHLWMTEVCHTNPPIYEFSDGDFWGNQLVSDLEAGASAWIYWNMILNEEGGPYLVSVVHGDPEHNLQQPIIVINRQTKQVTYTGLYYYMAHFSKFVRPGAVRIGMSGAAEGVRCIAFEGPDGRFVTELLNSRKSDVPITLGWRGRRSPWLFPPSQSPLLSGS